MDALTRVSYYFPTHTFTCFQILSNLVTNNVGYCQPQQRSLLIAMLVLFSVACLMACFTDTYSASNGQKYWVFMLPAYGPLCFSLPTDYDKDRVYDFFYLKVRDYVHATFATLAFILLVIFTNPTCACLFPDKNAGGTSRFDPTVVRTIPVVVALLISLIMICLGPPRQMLGFQNVPETGPAPEKSVTDNPIYAGSQMGPPSINNEEGDEMSDHDTNPRMSQGKMQPYRESFAKGARESYSQQQHGPPRAQMPSTRDSYKTNTPPDSYRGPPPPPDHYRNASMPDYRASQPPPSEHLRSASSVPHEYRNGEV